MPERTRGHDEPTGGRGQPPPSPPAGRQCRISRTGRQCRTSRTGRGRHTRRVEWRAALWQHALLLTPDGASAGNHPALRRHLDTNGGY